jgi:hypothetical protein
MRDEYLLARLQRVLAEDSSELGIAVVRRDDHYILTGEVESEQRRLDVQARVAEHFPELSVRNELMVTRVTKPGEPELLAPAIREGNE